MRAKLHPYQKRAYQAILSHPAYGLFLDMGLGKTLISLTAVYDLMYDFFTVRKVLIIAPRTVSEDTWQHEAASWDDLRDLRFSTILGAEPQRIRALNVEADCYVISRDFVRWLCEYYRFKLPFDMLIIDESTSFKSAKAKRWKALKKSRRSFTRALILTGSPRGQSDEALWPQIYLLDGGQRLGRTMSEFYRRYFVPVSSNGYVVYKYAYRTPDSRTELYSAIKDICMSMSAKDYLQLPAMRPINRLLHMSAHEAKLYKTFKRDLVAEIAGQEITALTAAALNIKLQQLASGQVYDEMGEAVTIHDHKLTALQEIAEVTPHLLVFYGFKSDRDLIMAKVSGAVLLTGAEQVGRWNKGEIPVLLAHPASCAYGLNLQYGGSCIVWYTPTWSYEQYIQANARVYRQGQTKPVTIIHLLTEDTIDTRIRQSNTVNGKAQDDMMLAVRAELDL